MKKSKRKHFLTKKKNLFLIILVVSFVLALSSIASATPTGNLLQQVGQALKGLILRVVALENKTQELENKNAELEETTSCIGVVEICNGLNENDCDGLTDDDLIQTCGSDVGECKKGIQICSDGIYGSCIGSIDPSSEICD